MDDSNKVNKALDIAKLINPEVQSLVLKMFAQAECTDQLKAENPAAYYEKSNNILAAIVGCASQMALGDGLPRHRLSGKLVPGSRVAWDLFLLNNPTIALKVTEAQLAKQAKMQAEMEAAKAEEDGPDNAYYNDGDENEDDS